MLLILLMFVGQVMIEKLRWFGHDAFRWDGSKIVYFDPWHLPAGAKKADIICVSHEHFDHCSAEDIAKISAKDTVIVASAEAAGQIRKAGIAAGEIRAMASGDTAAVGGVAIAATASYNIGKQFHPRKTNKLGFLVTMDGATVYHAGDTDAIPEMSAYRCDVALLPVSGTYVMTADEAAGAARAIRPKVAVPMHYGEVAGSPADAKRFSDLLKGEIEVKIPRKEV